MLYIYLIVVKHGGNQYPGNHQLTRGQQHLECIHSPVLYQLLLLLVGGLGGFLVGRLAASLASFTRGFPCGRLGIEGGCGRLGPDGREGGLSCG